MEKIIGVLERVSGHTYDTIYDLVFTNERVIAVIVQHPSDEIHKIGLKGLLLGERMAKGRVRPPGVGNAEARRRDYEEKTFDELMASHRFNFEIYYNNVSWVEITRRFFKSHLKFCVSRPSIRDLTIHFDLTKNQFTNTRQLLDLALPSKIKGK
jgi:hypothetical protein